MKKEMMFVFVFLFLVFCVNEISALGISPAFREYNFEPGFETSITYTVFAPEDMEVEVFANGDLAEYVSLSHDTVGGNSKFTATVSLPDVVEVPGKHRITIGAREKIDPEVVGGFIGTRVVVLSIIDVYVPYPGRYLEISLEGDDANAGENILFLLDIVSKGKEDVLIKPRIDIFSENEQVGVLDFSEREIKSQEQITLQKVLDTTGFNPGNYRARAVVDYGVLAEDDFDFRIGELRIDLINYTSVFPIDGLQKFELTIASAWNDRIDGAYGDVRIFNGSAEAVSFKTTSTDLVPWENKQIEGYFDSNNFTEGTYDANITLIYYGKEQGRRESEIVKVFFMEQKSFLLWYILAGVGLSLFVVLFLIAKFKNGKKKRKK